MDRAVIGQRGDFAISVSIPGKLSHCQSAQVSSNLDLLHTRFSRHLLFTTPTVNNQYFATVRDRDVHKRIVIKPAELNRARRRGQWLLHQWILEPLRGIIEYQQEIATAPGNTNGYISKPVRSAELSRSQRCHWSQQIYLLWSTKPARAIARH